VDAPVTYGMSLEEFREYYRDEYGRRSMEALDERLVRVEEKGTSSQIHASVDDLLQNNRAGDNEACISKQEIIRKYCLECPTLAQQHQAREEYEEACKKRDAALKELDAVHTNR